MQRFDSALSRRPFHNPLTAPAAHGSPYPMARPSGGARVGRRGERPGAWASGGTSAALARRSIATACALAAALGALAAREGQAGASDGNSPAAAAPRPARARAAPAVHRATRGAAASRWALQRFAASRAEASAAALLEDALLLELMDRLEARRAGPRRVLSAADIEHMLAFGELARELGCARAEQCPQVLFEQLQADRLLTPRLQRVGGALRLTVTALDTAGGEVAFEATLSGPTAAALREQLPALVTQLTGLPPPAPSRPGAAPPVQRLAVMWLEPRGVRAATARAITDIVAQEYHRLPGVEVISYSELEDLLRHADVECDLAGSSEALRCVMEASRALGNSRLLAGSVGLVDADNYFVSLQLLDLRAAGAPVLNRVQESYHGSPAELPHAARFAARSLIGAQRPQSAQIQLRLNAERATVRTGGRSYPLRDHRLQLGGLPPGRHEFQIVPESGEFLPAHQDFYLTSDPGNLRALRLESAPPPWYSHWWVWATVGVLAGAGAYWALRPARTGDVEVSSAPIGAALPFGAP